MFPDLMVRQGDLPTVAACIKRRAANCFTHLIQDIIDARQCIAFPPSDSIKAAENECRAKQTYRFHLEGLTWCAEDSGMIAPFHQLASSLTFQQGQRGCVQTAVRLMQQKARLSLGQCGAWLLPWVNVKCAKIPNTMMWL